MISRDINATKEREKRIFSIDIISRYREYYNTHATLNPSYEEPQNDDENEDEIQPQYILHLTDSNQYYLDIDYPEEFVRSPLKKYVRVVDCVFMMKIFSDSRVQEAAANEIIDIKTGFFRPSGISYTKDEQPENDFVLRGKIYTPKHVALYSSFVQDKTATNDCFVCFTNSERQSSNELFEVHTTQPSFRVWFIDNTQLKILSLASLAFRLAFIKLRLELYY